MQEKIQDWILKNLSRIIIAGLGLVGAWLVTEGLVNYKSLVSEKRVIELIDKKLDPVITQVNINTNNFTEFKVAIKELQETCTSTKVDVAEIKGYVTGIKDKKDTRNKRK